MFKNYLKIAWRNLFKYKVFSIINVTGLSLGIASCLMILQYVKFEYSYDTFQKDSDKIFRLKQNRYNQNVLTTEWAAGAAGVAQLVKNQIPEVESVTKFTQANAITNYKDKVFRENKMFYAYPNFLDFFSCEVIKGDAKTALNDLNSIVLTESMAKKYFENEDPIGKLISLNNKILGEFKVTAIIKDPLPNSHLNYSSLIPFAVLEKNNGDGTEKSFGWDGFYTYVKVKKLTGLNLIEDKINTIAQKKLLEEIGAQAQEKVEFKLQALKDIHLYSNYMEELEVNGDGTTVKFLSIIAFFILVIAWINFVNLSTSRSVDRAKEVGVRKVLGSFRSQLISQFMFESVLINFLAVIVALLLIALTLPFFSSLTGKPFNYNLFTEIDFWAILVALFVFGTLISGIYPAISLSSFMPIQTLKGKFSRSKKGSLLRHGLVVLQFSASVLLIVGTFGVYKQLKFMQEQDLGVNIKQTLVLKGPRIFDSIYSLKMAPFKNELATFPEIKKIAASTSVPGNEVGWNAGGISLTDGDPNKTFQFRPIGIDYNFIDTYGLKVLEGRSFSNDKTTDANESVLLNEEATKYFGFNKSKDALGKKINFWGNVYTIVGIVSNHHQESLKKSYDGHIYRLMPDVTNYFSLKIETDKANYPKTIASLKKLWDRTFPENPFDYYFLDENFEKQYQADYNFGKTFALFATIAIIIACLGLLGLVSFVTNQRTKEIGIRRVLGASIPNILYKLTLVFIKPVFVAILVTIPLSYYLLKLWLQNYAFKISISPVFFVIPVIIVVVIAVLTVVLQALKTVSINPVKSLKVE